MFSFKKLSIFSLLIALILSLNLSQAYAQSKKKTEQAETHLLKGKVVNAKSGEALTDAKVNIVGKKLNVNTGKDGTFMFEKLPKGTHTLKVDGEGYKKWKKKVKLKKDSKITIKVKPKSSN